eukprot:3094201-Pyramimonas_sp.AAC.1
MLHSDFFTWAVVTAAEHIHKYFQPEHKRGCGTNYEKDEEFGITRGMEEEREPKRRRMEEEGNLRLSKRIALSYMRET